LAPFGGIKRFLRWLLGCGRLYPPGFDPGIQDDLLDIRFAEIMALKNAGMLFRLAVRAFLPPGQFVSCAIREILQGLDTIFTERNKHRGGETLDLSKFVLDAKRPALLG
jgi:hypothetical protein